MGSIAASEVINGMQNQSRVLESDYPGQTCPTPYQTQNENIPQYPLPPRKRFSSECEKARGLITGEPISYHPPELDFVAEDLRANYSESDTPKDQESYEAIQKLVDKEFQLDPMDPISRNFSLHQKIR
eukprot:TRINITY_DN604_c0_g2_i1.p5 TRINITY_DN604_c0_g2~~TRINITY_DN604_c0_g2_i1.p5  ORF type:complete len:128 (-),score=4.23 TRINITY_DN604_c0_g2_i1:347-730(-)